MVELFSKKNIEFVINNLSNNIIMKKILKLIYKLSNDEEKRNICLYILKYMVPNDNSEILINSLEFKLKNNFDETMSKINIEKPYSFIHYLEDGECEDIDFIFLNEVTIEQFINVKNKDINRILKALNNLSKISSLEDKNEKFKGNTYWKIFKHKFIEDINKNNNLLLAYKIYLILGLDLSLELLNGYYGDIDLLTLYTIFDRCYTDNVKILNNAPELDSDLIRFISNDKKSNNNILRSIIDGRYPDLTLKFYEIYNDIENIKNIIGNKMKISDILEILKDTFLNPNPINYEFSSILNSYIVKSARKYAGDDRFSNAELIERATEYYYNNLYCKVYSSIPRVEGEYKDFKYEIMRLDDPIILILGYLTGNCFRVNGEGKSFLDYYAKSNNMRILIIRDKEEGIVGMVPIVRNGNAILGNGIELSKEHENFERREMIYNTIKKAYEDIISISMGNETDPIIVGLMSNRKHRVEAYSKRISWNQISPIYEDGPFINNFSETQYIIANDISYNTKGFRSFVPSSIYQDERLDVIGQEEHFKNRLKIEKIKTGIIGKMEDPTSFMMKLLNIHELFTVCNTDWIIIVAEGFKIFALYLNKDPRAKGECQYYINYFIDVMRDAGYKKGVNVDIEEVDVKNRDIYIPKYIKR